MGSSYSGTIGPSQLLTVKDVVTALRLSRTQVYALLLHDELQSIKIGRSRRILASSLEAFIERHRGTISQRPEDRVHTTALSSTLSSTGPTSPEETARSVPRERRKPR